MDTWLLTEGYSTEDNHGSVEDVEEVLCAQLFNIMGRLHEILKERLTKENKCESNGENPIDRIKPVPEGY